MTELKQAIGLWINTNKPGPFPAEGASGVWRLAYASFKRSTDLDVVDLEFQMAMHELGYATRISPLGGWLLERPDG